MAIAVGAAGLSSAEASQGGLGDNTSTTNPAPATNPTPAASDDSQFAGTSQSTAPAAAPSGTVTLAAVSVPLGPPPLTPEQQQYIANGQLAGQAVGVGGGGAAGCVPGAVVGAVAGGVVGTAVAGPLGTIPGAVIGGGIGCAVTGVPGAAIGYQQGGPVGAGIAEKQVRGQQNGASPASSGASGSFGSTVAGMPLLAP